VVAYYRIYELPWESGCEEDERLRKIFKRVGIAVLVLSIVMSVMPLPEIERDQIDKVPPRFAKLMLEKTRPLPPPPVVQPIADEPKLEPKLVQETKPEPEPVITPEPVDRTEEARKKASVAGLLPFADDLAELRDNQAIASVTADRQLAGAAGQATRTERSLITSKAGKSSGGINTAGMSRNTGGAGLAGHSTTAVSSTVAGLGGGTGSQRPRAGDRPARSREEIEMVFDKNKGAIYALYNRALRRDSTLQGKLVLKITIEPSGVVSFCEVLSSELDDEELQHKLIQRIKLFRFLEKDVAPVTTTKPIDFFPA
jgi:outer membrane biosynthesis protein TonB